MGIGSACAGNRPGRHVTLEHFVITRFCLRDRWLHRRTGLTAFRTMDPLTPRTVDLRLSLLETTCLPALRSQTNRDFTWILLIDRDLGRAARQRLRDMTHGMDRVRFVEYRADAPQPLERLGWLAPLWQSRPDYVVTTLNDDDDALPRRWIEVVQSHARHLAAQDRLPPFQLAGARRIVQWDMIFTPGAPFGWAGPWRGLASVASCGFSLLCRWPAFDFSVFGLSHMYAETYGDFLTPSPSEHVRLVRQWLVQAARDARVGRIPMGRDAFFDASHDAGAVVIANHGGNFEPWRLNRGPWPGENEGPALERGFRPADAATFPDVEIDWQAAERHHRHFRPWRVRSRLLEHRLHEGRRTAVRRLRELTNGIRSRLSLGAPGPENDDK